MMRPQNPCSKSREVLSLLILFINGQKMVSNDANLWKTDFLPPNHCPIIFHTMSPLFSQMSPNFQVPWDIVPGYEISRQNTAYVERHMILRYILKVELESFISTNDDELKTMRFLLFSA